MAEPARPDRTALYVTIRSEAGDTLVGVEAEGAGETSIHETIVEDEVMRMRPVDGVAVPAGGTARLRPGGFHGMLEDLGPTWSAGDTVRVRLVFRNAGMIEAPALVVPYAELDARFPRESGGG